MKAFECKNITVLYDRQIAVQNVSFSIDRGDYLCIVGENGSGKSSLVKALLGLIPIKSGSFNFYNIQKQQIAYLPQKSQIQRDFPANVYEVVMSGCVAGCKSPFFCKHHRQLANQQMECLEIGNLKKKPFSELSGGQQQRVLLARTLCADSKILFLDEPVTGLDPSASAEFYSIINKLNKENGLTVVMISHDTAQIAKYADKILQLDSFVKFFGSKNDYLSFKGGIFHA